MDWELAIKRNREALLGIVAGLAAMAGMMPMPGSRMKEFRAEVILPSRLRLTILRILRPAESALRRLIVIVAAMRTQSASKLAGREAGASLPDFPTFARRKTLPAFRLFDQHRRFDASRPRAVANPGIPRISVPGFFEPAPITSTGNDNKNAAAIFRRIAALDHALKTLPRQARRFNRLIAQRAKAKPGSGRLSPLRRGLPPGWRRRPVHDVDAVLRECHGLAFDCGFKPP